MVNFMRLINSSWVFAWPLSTREWCLRSQLSWFQACQQCGWIFRAHHGRRAAKLARRKTHFILGETFSRAGAKPAVIAKLSLGCLGFEDPPWDVRKWLCSGCVKFQLWCLVGYILMMVIDHDLGTCACGSHAWLRFSAAKRWGPGRSGWQSSLAVGNGLEGAAPGPGWIPDGSLRERGLGLPGVANQR